MGFAFDINYVWRTCSHECKSLRSSAFQVSEDGAIGASIPIFTFQELYSCILTAKDKTVVDVYCFDEMVLKWSRICCWDPRQCIVRQMR